MLLFAGNFRDKPTHYGKGQTHMDKYAWFLNPVRKVYLYFYFPPPYPFMFSEPTIVGIFQKCEKKLITLKQGVQKKHRIIIFHHHFFQG